MRLPQLMSLDELLAYDAEGIVPFSYESKRTFRQRAKKILKERNQFLDFLTDEKYSQKTCGDSAERYVQLQTSFPEDGYRVHREKQEQLSFFSWPYLRSEGERSIIKPWTWPLLWLLPAAGAGEYFLGGSVATGFFLGYLASKIGIGAYRYCKAAYCSSRYHQEREAIAANEAKTTDLIATSYPFHTTYLLDRLEHDDWKKLIVCEKNEDLQKTIEQMQGLKWEIIRERLRREGYGCTEPKWNLLKKIPKTWMKNTAERLALLFCSAALFFESSFGYRDYKYNNEQFAKAVQENSISSAKELKAETHLTGSLPIISTGYRALHHSLWHEGQVVLEESFPVCSWPGIKHVLMIYTYMGSGVMASAFVKGHYSPSQQEIALIHEKDAVSLSLEDKYTLLHELGHHYVHLANPLLSSRSLSENTIANSIFHEGLAEYLSIQTMKKKEYVLDLERYHRCMYLIAMANKFIGYENPHFSKAMHYSMGFSFVDYALSEVGQEHLPTLIHHPPTIDDFLSPEQYILRLKQKLGQPQMIYHPEKNPARAIKRYLLER